MPDMELLEYLQKSQEQNMEAFNILAENLGKMLRKQEMRDSAEEDMKRKMEDEKMSHEREEMEKAKWDSLAKSLYEYVNKSLGETTGSITKAVSDTVLAAVKQVYQGMDVDATKAHNVDGGNVTLPKQDWPMASREHRDVDKEVPGKVRADTKSVQNPIQAMQKHDVMYKDEEMPVKDETLNEYPAVEDENADRPTLEEMQKAYAELKAMKDEMTNMKKSFDSNVSKAVADKMKKFNIHEEKSYMPKVTKAAEIGGTELPVKKSLTIDEEVNQLKNVKTSDLMNEWLRGKGFNVGGASSVPQELVANAS